MDNIDIFLFILFVAELTGQLLDCHPSSPLRLDSNLGGFVVLTLHRYFYHPAHPVSMQTFNTTWEIPGTKCVATDDERNKAIAT